MTRSLRLALSAALAALASPAAAETRSYTITSFDRVRIDGPYAVTVRTNSGSFARATGSAAAPTAVARSRPGAAPAGARSTCAPPSGTSPPSA